MAYTKQYYGITFPFTIENDKGIMIDLNEGTLGTVRSKLYHLIFTPVGQRYRMPEFGTNLLKWIFEMQDSTSWGGVMGEIQSKVEKYVPEAKVNNISVEKDDNNEDNVYVKLSYTVTNGANSEDATETIKLT